MDGDRFFGIASVLSYLPAGWEANALAMSKAQDAVLASCAPALVARIAEEQAAPVLFRNVTLYDSEALLFRPGMSVLVDKGLVRAVGPAAGRARSGSSRGSAPRRRRRAKRGRSGSGWPSGR